MQFAHAVELNFLSYSYLSFKWNKVVDAIKSEDLLSKQTFIKKPAWLILNLSIINMDALPFYHIYNCKLVTQSPKQAWIEMIYNRKLAYNISMEKKECKSAHFHRLNID